MGVLNEMLMKPTYFIEQKKSIAGTTQSLGRYSTVVLKNDKSETLKHSKVIRKPGRYDA